MDFKLRMELLEALRHHIGKGRTITQSTFAKYISGLEKRYISESKLSMILCFKTPAYELSTFFSLFDSAQKIDTQMKKIKEIQKEIRQLSRKEIAPLTEIAESITPTTKESAPKEADTAKKQKSPKKKSPSKTKAKADTPETAEDKPDTEK